MLAYSGVGRDPDGAEVQGQGVGCRELAGSILWGAGHAADAAARSLAPPIILTALSISLLSSHVLPRGGSACLAQDMAILDDWSGPACCGVGLPSGGTAKTAGPPYMTATGTSVSFQDGADTDCTAGGLMFGASTSTAITVGPANVVLGVLFQGFIEPPFTMSGSWTCSDWTGTGLTNPPLSSFSPAICAGCSVCDYCKLTLSGFANPVFVWGNYPGPSPASVASFSLSAGSTHTLSLYCFCDMCTASHGTFTLGFSLA